MSNTSTYEIVSELGRGAMGVVYHARQKPLDRDVALKLVLPDQQTSGEYVARFHREAQSLSKLSHPNLVTVFDSGTLDGRPYIAMELIRGQTLQSMLVDDPIAARRQGDEIFAQMLRGIAALHERGMVHRDLKPANVMITPEGRVVVMDLGLVRDVSGDGTLLTKQGALIGTPMYLAPEVLAGQAADRAADVWALGCIYFHLQAGFAPFSGESLPLLAAAIISGPLPNLAAACPDLDEGRYDFLARLLDRDLERRPKDARRVVRLFEGRPITASLNTLSIKRPTASGGAGSPGGRARWILAGLAVGIAAIVGWAMAPRAGSRDPLSSLPPRPVVTLPPGSRSGTPPLPQADLLKGVRGLGASALLTELEKEVTHARSLLSPGQPLDRTLRDRWKSKLESLVNGRGLRVLISQAQDGLLSQPTTRADLALVHNEVVNLWFLMVTAQQIGVDLSLDVPALLPYAQGPMKVVGAPSHESQLVEYSADCDLSKLAGPNAVRAPAPSSWEVQLRRVDDALSLGGARSMGVKTDLLDKRVFVNPKPIPMRQPAPHEQAVLTVCTRLVGPAEFLVITLSSDAGKTWSPPAAVLRGRAGETHTDFHYRLPDGLLGGPRMLRIEYRHVDPRRLYDEVSVLGVLVRYVDSSETPQTR